MQYSHGLVLVLGEDGVVERQLVLVEELLGHIGGDVQEGVPHPEDVLLSHSHHAGVLCPEKDIRKEGQEKGETVCDLEGGQLRSLLRCCRFGLVLAQSGRAPAEQIV